jgi:hypothetical protein
MNAYRIETRVPDNHLLHISVPTFAVGEDVDVIILAKNTPPREATPHALHGTLLRYDDPTEPISLGDWEALQ